MTPDSLDNIRETTKELQQWRQQHALKMVFGTAARLLFGCFFGMHPVANQKADTHIA
jgi:hypothetical protein